MAKLIPLQEGKIMCNINKNSKKKEGLVIEEWDLTNNFKSRLSCYYDQNQPYGFSKFIVYNPYDLNVREEFKGELLNKRADGYGIFTDMNGEYEGDWTNDNQNGIGIENTPDNSTYKGEFRNGIKQGIGVYTWQDGSSYAGEWDNNKFNGYGMYTFSNGKRYNGHFVDGEMNGYGELIWERGDAYLGGIKKGKKHGYGLYTLTRNQKNFVYIGFFANDKLNGFGKLMNQENEQYGMWNMGKLEKKYELYEFKSALRNQGLREYIDKFELSYQGFLAYYHLCLKTQ